jgi:phage gpG-like protein
VLTVSTVTHRVNDAQLNVMLHGPQGAVARDMYRRGHRVLGEARRRCPVDTGRLRSSLSVRLVAVHGDPAAVIGTNVKYAGYVMRGTGLYGPRHRPITPVHAKVLVFRGRGGEVVFARSVKGSPARPFLQLALLAARD